VLVADVTVRNRFNLALVTGYGVFWFALAVAPVDRATWWLENVLVFISVPLLVWGYFRLPLSRISYVMLVLFFCFHAIGSHFTYSIVPYDSFWMETFGASINETLGFERNHYDRFVHFCFGLLLAYPCREIFVRIAGARGFWGYFLPVMLMMALSVSYELIEWAAAVVFGGDLGIHYLGTQGDVWDGHRDMGLASLGALLSMLLTLGINLSLQRDFAVEWHDSLRVKDPEPLGEVAIKRMLHDEDVPQDPRL
jgi:putative membrane protein